MSRIQASTAEIITNNAEQRHNRFWEVKVKYPGGEEATRFLFLPNARAVRKEIEESGAYILSIKEKVHSAWQREWFSRDYKINFLKSMLFHIDVGSSPGKALMLVIEAEKNPRKRIDLEPALQIIKRGGMFSDAIGSLTLFSRPIIAILQAGEFSGLKTAIADAIVLLQTRKGVIATLLGAISVLAIDLVVCFSTVVSMQFFALPMLEKTAPSGADAAKIEQYQATINQAYVYNGLLLAITVVVIAFFLMLFVLSISSKRGRDIVGDMVARMPLLRTMVFDSLISDSFLLLSRMLSSGVSLTNSVLILASVAPLSSLKKIWESIYDSLSAGESVSKAFSESKVLIEAERMVLEAHQDNSQLVKILTALSEQRRESATYGSKQFQRVAWITALLYVLATVGISFMVLQIQDLGVSASFDTMMR